jgi:hypothetical protein
MEAEGILTTLAEVAIAIAGFSGIVVALDRSEGPWSELDRVRLSMLLQVSISCVFWSLLPIFLNVAEVVPASIWFWSSAMWLVYIFVVLGYRLRRQLPNLGQLDEDTSVRPVLAFILFTVTVSIILQIANVGWLMAPWPYVLAVLEGILVSCLFFVRLLSRVVKVSV